MTYVGTRPEVILSDEELAFLNEPTAMAPGALAGIAVASVLALLATLALIAMKRIYKPKKSKWKRPDLWSPAKRVLKCMS